VTTPSPATTSHKPRVKMKSSKEKKQPLGTFIYPPSNLTTYLPNQIQTCVYKLPALQPRVYSLLLLTYASLYLIW
jgi:hypothetical protein